MTNNQNKRLKEDGIKVVSQWELLKDMFYALIITPVFFSILILIIKYSYLIDEIFD